MTVSNNVHYDYKLNNLNQLVQKTYSSNDKEGTLYTYDGRGNLVKEEYGKLNGNGNSKRTTVAEYTYDETNKMVKGVNSIGESSSYLFNGKDALVEQTWHIAKNGYGYHDVDAGVSDPADTGNGKSGTGSSSKGKGNGTGQGNGNGSGDKPTGTTVGSFSTVVKQFVIDYTRETQDPLMEHEVNGLDYRYVYGNERLSVNISPIENGSGHIVESGAVGQQIRLYYHQDLRGTVDYLTSPVSQKVESWTHYNEWGEITHNAVLKCGQRELDLVKHYATHDFDVVLNMYYAKARMYDAENRRFTSLDPIMDGSVYDISEQVTDPMMFTQYLYVKENPLRWVDPLGLIWMINPHTWQYRNLGNPIFPNRRSAGYYSLDKATAILSDAGCIYYDNTNSKVMVNAVSTNGIENNAYILEISTKNAKDRQFISSQDVTVYDATKINTKVSGRTPKIYFQDGQLYISLNDMLNLINEDGYFKRVSCDGNGDYYFDTRTSAHYEIANYARQFNISFEPWTLGKIAKWKTYGGDDYINTYKKNWIKSFAPVIKDAAEKYDVSAFAIAQVAFVEVGGDPMFVDRVAYGFRSTFHKSNSDTGTFNKNPQYTSFGYLSMQVRRAAETTDYQGTLSETQINTLIESLEDPVQNIYFAAKHLSYLRTIDFSHIEPENMTDEQWSVTVERYNRGPDISYDKIKNNHGYADTILPFKEEILEYLK